jgi:hypothetical protein
MWIRQTRPGPSLDWISPSELLLDDGALLGATAAASSHKHPSGQPYYPSLQHQPGSSTCTHSMVLYWTRASFIPRLSHGRTLATRDL